MDITALQEAKKLIIETAQNSENFDNADFRDGTIFTELHIKLAALGYAILEEELDDFEDKMFLKQALENPETFDSATLDSILSNFRVTRSSGTKAVGILKVKITNLDSFLIEEDVEFESSLGLVFKTTADTTIETDDIFQQDGDTSAYYFFINVTAEEVGANYSVEEGSTFTTTIYTTVFQEIVAYSDFSLGTNEESNSELLDRVPTSIGATGLFNRQSIETLLRSNFSNLSQITSMGYNDREMQRNKNFLGLKVAGPIDIYIKTQSEPSSKILLKTTDVNNQVLLSTSTEIPILRVKYVSLANNIENSKTTNFTTTVEHSDSDKTPSHYRFSTQERIRIQCPTTADYTSSDIAVTVEYLSTVKDVQDYVDGTDIQFLKGDNLIRSFMPCFITLNISYRTSSSVSQITYENSIKDALIEYINAFSDNIIYTSQIINILYNNNITHVQLPLILNGSFYLPDGSIEEVEDEDKLEIDDDFDLGLSKDTYRFFISRSDITLTRLT